DALWQTGLPDADRVAAGFGHDAHAAEIHPRHRGNDHRAGPRRGGIRGCHRVLDCQVDRPVVGSAALAVVAHAPGDLHALLREVEVAAALRTGLLARAGVELVGERV